MQNLVIIEAGAHIGLDTCEMAKMQLSAKILEFNDLIEDQFFFYPAQLLSHKNYVSLLYSFK